MNRHKATILNETISRRLPTQWRKPSKATIIYDPALSVHFRDDSKTKPTHTAKIALWRAYRIGELCHTRTADPLTIYSTTVTLSTTPGAAIRNRASVFPAPSSHATSVLSRVHIYLRPIFRHFFAIMHQTSLSETKFIRSQRTSANPLKLILSLITLYCPATTAYGFAVTHGVF